MPLKLAVPLEKNYILEKSDKKYGSPDDESTYVRFRQVTNAEKEIIEDLMEPQRIWNAQGEMSMRQSASNNQIMRKLIFLTMTDCNITTAAGAKLFHFEDGRLVNEEEFTNSWGFPPADVAEEIMAKALEANPLWPAQEKKQSKS